MRKLIRKITLYNILKYDSIYVIQDKQIKKNYLINYKGCYFMGIFVLIGGGENGRKGTEYETEKIDQEIVSLFSLRKEKNFLFLAHGSDFEKEYYEIMKKNYEKLGCKCDILYKKDLKNISVSQNKVNWANIIYVGGGNTLKMMNLWRKYNFDKLLNVAKNEDKILCGISAGAISFCKCGISDSRKTEKNDTYIKVQGLNYFDILFCPSYDEKNSYTENINNILKKEKAPMIALEKGTAIIFKEDTYRIIKSIKDKKAYKIFCYKKNKFIFELLNTAERNIHDLFIKNEV